MNIYAEKTDLQVICGRTPRCGFRVNEHYFAGKPRFSRSSCPSCGGPLQVVAWGTDTASSHHVDWDSGRVAED